MSLLKTIRVYPNSKREVSAEMQQCIKERRAAFISGDLDPVKLKRTEFNSILWKNSMKYKEKVESALLW